MASYPSDMGRMVDENASSRFYLGTKIAKFCLNYFQSALVFGSCTMPWRRKGAARGEVIGSRNFTARRSIVGREGETVSVVAGRAMNQENRIASPKQVSSIFMTVTVYICCRYSKQPAPS